MALPLPSREADVDLPFSRTAFLEVFGRYNEAVWPAQVALHALGLFAVWEGVHAGTRAGRRILGVLAALWIWMGIVYHWGFFASINPAANVFGALFLMEGVLLVALASGTRELGRVDARAGPAAALGWGLVVYALLLYPLAGMLAGRTFPRAPGFGLPCPTTIFTLGVLLWIERVPRAAVLIPLGWVALGSVAAMSLDVAEDFGLLVAGLLAAPILLRRRHAAAVIR